MLVVGDGWNLTVVETLEASVLAGTGIVFTGDDVRTASRPTWVPGALIPRAVRAAPRKG